MWNFYTIVILNLLSVETHRRAATGNTKSREVAGALAGTAPSSTARNSGARRGLWRRRACHLTYTRSGGCRRAPNSFLHTKTRVNISPSRGRLPGTTLASALKSRSSPGVRVDLYLSRYWWIKQITMKLLQLNLINLIHDGNSFTARSEHPTRDWA